MDISKISIGKKAPEEVNMIVENPMGGLPVKYELDKDSGALEVDRFIHTPMFYPGNYGFIPHTLSDDGDPVDVIAIGQLPVIPGAVMAVRPVGVLLMEDEGGQDEKIVARPIDKLFPYHANIHDYMDIQPILREQIEHFFTHYKDLEKSKWVKVSGWANADRARELIQEGIARLNKTKNAA
ncbi:MAG: inorganic diphosphatase [Rhodospirillales bacterium]|nr:inorganic diphosphatase [Rhodospirillales bacterium]MCB9973531.1 inorganic diphosphatase [Rhodospirillales bacterium]MCB9980673.1 inorganic diphosphatase [Rhodospirillales bacterium]